MNIDEAWNSFIDCGEIEEYNEKEDITENHCDDIIPKPSELYISTKTKIIYLTKEVDLYNIFWKLDIMPYDTQSEGIIKKQIKIISNSESELNDIKLKLQTYKYYDEHIITHLEQHQSDVNIYKDVRKITVGISKKDILSYRSKQKSAFYNCFVLILRIKNTIGSTYKEVHVKIFNTGKVEIPGVQNDDIFEKCCNYVITILNNKSTIKYDINKSKTETILINSNFHCGFCINRQLLFDILRSKKYNLNVSYDPCSYPGIQCKYTLTTFTISFMIFRTGSILIVGKSNDKNIYDVYEFLKKTLYTEYHNIREIYSTVIKVKEKVQKSRKKIIYIDI
tara:strand:+ start:2911 stop:3918 length:1008 start_codon:yes stop_codon:yes gene_type:complete